MAFALTFIGLLMIVTGANNTYAPFGAQLKADFTGDKSFVLYIAAIGGVGALGYVPELRRFSHYFMALILISLVLSNKGFFQNFTAALSTSPVAPTASATSAGSSPSITSSDVASAAKDAATGNNPGSDLIGSLTSTYLTNPFKSFFGLK